MIKKICFAIFLFFCLILNVFIDMNIEKYISILEKCFGKRIILTDNLYTLICSIIALISVLIVLDILLVFKKKTDENKGIKLKTGDGTYGTANWMNEKEMTEVLSFDKAGIILGKYNNKFVKLPFDSYFNKNMSVFGSSGSMKTIRISLNKLT